MRSIRNIATDVLFLILVLILFAVSWLSVTRIDSLVTTSNLLNKNRRIETKLEQTFLYLTDAESVQREYLLTNDTVFLHHYFTVSDQIRASISQLDSLIADNRQKKSLSAIKEIAANKFLLEQSLNKSLSDKSIQLLPLLMENKMLMDSLRMHIRHIEQVDENLVNNEMKKRRQLVFVTPLITAIIVFTTLVIATISYFLVRRDKAILSELNIQLKAKNIELEQRNTELSSFYDIYSHDLQEPLRKIQLFSERIESTEAGNLSSRGADYFSRIRQAAQRMQNLIQALVNFSQAISTEHVVARTDLNTVIREVGNTLKERMQKKSAIIECGDLPVLHVVPAQIRELFAQLISNALQYSRADAPVLIKITAEKVTSAEVPGKVKQKANFWQIKVQDNGIGFDPAYGNKIFELFERLQNRPDVSGTGIGLAICRKIVQAHNGIITATGDPGKGATFSVFLPE